MAGVRPKPPNQWPPERLEEIRSMVNTWVNLTVAEVYGDESADLEVAVLTGTLIGFVPDLIDEIERLQARAVGHTPVAIVKMDSRSGSA